MRAFLPPAALSFAFLCISDAGAGRQTATNSRTAFLPPRPCHVRQWALTVEVPRGSKRISSLEVAARRRRESTTLSEQPKKNLGSYYRRPAAAVERGGGFFIPGFQGYRLQLTFSVGVLVLLVLNRLPGYPAPVSQFVSELAAAASAAALLLQATIASGGERAVREREESVAAAANAASANGAGVGPGGTGDYIRAGSNEDALRWAANILLQLTPACTFLALADDGEVMARIGLVNVGGGGDGSGAAAAAAAAMAEARAAAKAGTGSAGAVGRESHPVLMDLLSAACLRGLVLLVPVASGGSGGGGGGSGKGAAVVFLGSTRADAGAFSPSDTAYATEVVRSLSLPP